MIDVHPLVLANDGEFTRLRLTSAKSHIWLSHHALGGGMEKVGGDSGTKTP